MQIRLHKQATTTPKVRAAIQASDEPAWVLAPRHGTTEQTAHLNADGLWERVERDVDEDGNIDRTKTYTYDGNGNRTRIDIDLDGDGTIDRIAHVNADGRWERVERDVDDDGNIDRITHYTFDDDGNRRVTRRDADLDDDGTIDRIEYDDDGDGTIDRTEAITQSANGNVVQIDFDDDADGTVDRSEARNYVNGRLIHTDFDDDGDGRTDRIEGYGYGTTGNLLVVDFFDANGNHQGSENYTCDAAGEVIRTRFDDDADGTHDRSESYTRDVQGRVIETRFDDDGDGSIDRIETYEYGSRFTRARTGFDDDADGTTDRSERSLSSLDGTNGFILSGTVTEDGVTYNVYRDGNAQVRLEDGVSVTLAAAGSQSARSLTAHPDLMPDLSHADAREGIDGTGLHFPGSFPGHGCGLH